MCVLPARTDIWAFLPPSERSTEEEAFSAQGVSEPLGDRIHLAHSLSLSVDFHTSPSGLRVVGLSSSW